MSPEKFGTELARLLNETQRQYHCKEITCFDAIENLRSAADHLERLATQQAQTEEVATYRVALNLAAQALAELSKQPFDAVVNELLENSREKVGRSVRLVA